MRFKISVRVILATLIITVGCGPALATPPSTTTAGRKSGGRLVMTLDVRAISTLDPVVPHDNSAIWTILNLYDQLFRVAKDGQSVALGLIRERIFNKDFDVAKGFNSSDVIDPSQHISNYLCRFTQPVMGVCNVGIDQLYAETQYMIDPDQRRAAFFRLMQMASEWSVYIPLYYAPARTAIWDRVKGFQVLPTGNFRLWEVWLDE